MERTDKPDEAMRAYLEQRLPKGMRNLPLERYFEAKKRMKQMQRYSTAKGELLPSEAKTGKGDIELLQRAQEPTPSAGSTGGVLGTWQSLGPGNVGGRTRALIIDPGTPNTMYAAGVAGGIWKTTDGGASWFALDDFMANIAVTCLAFEPGNPSVIYASTGEGFFNGDAVRGAGIFKSTDAGATWTRLASTTTSDFFFVQDIVVGNGANSQHVYAATRTGVWRSLDGGANWAQVIVSNAANGANGAMDLAIRTDQATDYVYAALGTIAQSHIFRNTDAGGSGTWVDVYTETNMGRTSLAIAPSNQNVIYAMSSNNAATTIGGISYQDALLAVFRSTSSGDTGTWTTQVRNTSANKQDTLLLMNPVYAVLVECGFGAANQPFNQGWYDNVLAVDPTDSDKVWAGGIDVWRSDNGGVNWAVASYWWFQGNGTPPNNGDPQLVHADNHTIVFHPNYNGTSNQTMFVGDDGGIYKTDNAKDGNVGYVSGTSPSGGTITSTSPICGNEYTPGGFYTVPSPVIWGPLNNGYAVTQFWPGAVYPDGTTYFGGTQDNGTNRGTDASGPNQWSRILGGDGGFAAVDPTNTNILYAENTNLSFQKSVNGGASWVAARSGITEASGNFLFTAPFYMDPTNSARLYLGGARVWKTTNSAGTWTSASGFLGFRVSALATSPQDANYGVFGGQAGHIWRTQTLTTDAIPAGSTSTWSFARPRTDFVSWVAFDPTNKNVVYATYSTFNAGTNVGHVWKSTDAGATWAVIDGSGANAIPDIPVHTIIVDPNNTQRLYVGTDLGIFVTLDGGANWAKETTGFSNTVVKSLQVLNVGGVSKIYAFTHGRGAFKVAIPASCTTVTTSPQNFSGAANTGSFTVTSASGECSWNAVSNSPFITITSGQSGSGNGTVNFSITQNTTGAPRSGTLTIAGTVVTVNQAYSALLSMTKVAEAATIDMGKIFSYTVTVSNAGPTAASNVVVTDALPASMTFYSATPSQGTCAFTSGNHTATCSLGSVSSSSSATITIKVKGRQEGVFNNTATFTSPDFDPTTASNSASAQVTIVKYADLKVTKVDSADPIYVGEQTTYSMTVKNFGPVNAASGVTLTDSLPSSMTFVSATTSQGNLVTPPVGSTGTVTANLGSLAVNATATVTVTVQATQAGAVTNTASSTGNETDPNTANNTASQTTTVNQPPVLQKVLLSNQSPVGGCQPYPTGQVYLTAPAPAGGVTVTLSSTNAGATVPASVFIAAGQTKSPSFTVTTQTVTRRQDGNIVATLGPNSVMRNLQVYAGSCPP